MLVLFSSNIRPLYEQDILDVIGAPSGVVFQFRYMDYLLNAGAEAAWTDLDEKTDVVVYFSLQQRAQFHPAVFFPIRFGHVRRCWRDARFRFVEFYVGDYASLPSPRTKASHEEVAAALEKEEHEVKERDILAYYVKKHAAELDELAIDLPYRKSASYHPDFGVSKCQYLVRTGEPTERFEVSAKYLAQTASFERSVFVRCLHLRVQGDEKDIDPGADGVFDLKAGKTYQLSLLQSQPREVIAVERYEVSCDGDLIKVIGDSSFEIASPYDVIALSMHAYHPGGAAAAETVVVLQPRTGSSGPRIRLRFRVRLSKSTIATAGASIVLLMVVGLPALMEEVSVGWKILPLAIGAIGANLLWLFAPHGRNPLTPKV